MARGSPAPNPLPKVSFVKVTDEVNQKNPGVYDHVAKTYGYNDGSEFQQPEHYIRYIEPLESDLAIQVEYDMDEQDQEWLDALNAERKAQQLDKVTYETFEIVMDRLEKEWFDLTKNLPKPDMALPSEDSTCAICDDSEGENTNAIVFCDGCNLAVHQDCYGVPYIPEGQWLCRKCTVSPENPVSCVLCPNEGGAFKQTVSGDWVHLLCAIWIPETSVANEVFMEPITGVERISKQRWKLRCSVCDVKYGACIQCTKPSCFTAFHATCARKEKFLMPMKASQGSEAPTLACYCEKHLPREQQEVRAAMYHAAQPDGMDGDGLYASPKSNKTMRAYNKQYKPGPPLVPKIMVNRILQYISKIQLRHKSEFVHLVCKYWSLKREARRGAPLLKRLHLEPWTALSGSKQQTDEEKALKLDHMKRLRSDLERLRIIADVVQRRERFKREQANIIQSVLLHFFFPHERFLRLAFENITSLDRQEYFKSPVSKAEVPDYYEVIKSPMCWDMIEQKLDRHEYLDLVEFKRDISLVVNNAMTYNQTSTPFYRTAQRIQGIAQTELAKLDRLMNRPIMPVPITAPLPSTEPVDEKPHIESTPLPDLLDTSRPPIGDLEPSLDILNLLVSEESIRRDTNIIVTTNPITSLLNYELPLIRPPAPPPPPLPSARQKFQKLQKPKPKVDRKTALERKKQERKKLALDASPGFRAPRTRSAIAAAVAFEAEATGSSQTPETDQSVAGPSSSTPTPADKHRKPRKSMALPTQDLPITVEDVDSRQSFKMFEVGWILPPDQKRGGRAPVERSQLPPPRKRAKTTHDKTLLSNVSPAPVPSSAGSEFMQTEGALDASLASERGPSMVSEFSQSEPPAAARAPTHLTDPSELQPETESQHTPPPGSSSPRLSSTIRSSVAPPELTNILEPPSGSEPEFISVPDTDMVTMVDPILVPEHTDVPEHVAELDPPSTSERPSTSTPEAHPTLEPQPKPLITQEAVVLPGPELELDTQKGTRAVSDPQASDAVPMEVDEGAVSTPEAPLQEEETAQEELPTVVPVIVEAPAELPIEESQPKQPPEPRLKSRPGPQSAPDVGPAPQAESDPEPEPQPETGPDSALQMPPPQPESTPKADRGPRRVIIIEELDTPAIRREKYLRKKAERLAARERASAELAAAQRREQGIPEDAMDVDSDLTDLSDLDDEPAPAPASEPMPRSVAKPVPRSVVKPQGAHGPAQRNSQSLPAELGVITLNPGEKLEGGTLVWAKLDSFPWWPAVVFENDDPEIPMGVLTRAPDHSDSTNVLVRFYEKTHNNNWAWVKIRNLRYLGEDDALDAEMLATPSKYQRWRNNSRRMECRNAYQDALAEMEAAENGGAMLQGHATGGTSAKTSTSQLGSGTGADIVPAAMGADSPMTEVD